MKHDKRFDGFSVSLYEDEDGDWVAYFAELSEISACGDDPESAIEELAVAWEVAKESYVAHRKPIPIAASTKIYSGQFNVRIDKRLHKELAIEAQRAGISLNALVAQKLLLSTARGSNDGHQSDHSDHFNT